LRGDARAYAELTGLAPTMTRHSPEIPFRPTILIAEDDAALRATLAEQLTCDGSFSH
jgi:hypothetical protein